MAQASARTTVDGAPCCCGLTVALAYRLRACVQCVPVGGRRVVLSIPAIDCDSADYNAVSEGGSVRASFPSFPLNPTLAVVVAVLCYARSG